MKKIVSALCVLVLAACGAPAPDAAPVVVDSAGITLVTNTAEQFQALETWSLDSVPLFEVAGAEGAEVVLYQVREVVPLRGGRLAVANDGSDEVLVLDREGHLIRRLGRPGDGPGEFQSTGSIIELPGDSIGVYDYLRRRLTVFDPSAEVAREANLGPLASQTGWSRVLPLAGGDYVYFTDAGFPTPAEPGTSRGYHESYRISAVGESLASYGSFPGAEVFTAEAGRAFVLYGAITSATVLGDALVVGTGERTELTFYSRDGRQARVTRWPDEDRTVTPERVQEFIEAAVSRMPEERRPRARTRFEEMPRAERHPPYEGLIASPEGDVWIGAYLGPEVAFLRAPTPRRSWLILDSAGVLKARLWTPRGFQPHAAQGDTLTGVFTDEFGVESLRGYVIVRG